MFNTRIPYVFWNYRWVMPACAHVGDSGASSPRK